MDIQSKAIKNVGTKFYIKKNGQEVARAYLYVLHNDLHKEPFGLMEDVFVDEVLRGLGLGSDMVRMVIKEAKEKGCYKLICTSRNEKPKVHEFYRKLGFREQGKEFRIDF
ncbi:MAG TPA: GNAT family N-acetyltransferase [Candidatus Nanoarchaeia archaeon]|nr:GNAT family N-acetyltransferase [Candidatus Nanoarchaeia archaeon]